MILSWQKMTKFVYTSDHQSLISIWCARTLTVYKAEAKRRLFTLIRNREILLDIDQCSCFALGYMLCVALNSSSSKFH